MDAGWHGTLREVLAAWTARGGWTLVWKASAEYAIDASAEFEGGLLEAVDQLFSAVAVRRALTATAYTANRYRGCGDRAVRRAARVAVAAAVSWTLTTGGCARLQSVGRLDAAPVVARDRAEAHLIEAAVRAQTALAALAHARTGEATLAPAPLPRIVPGELLRRVSVDFIGPLETLVAELAERAGYRLVVAGAAPVRPLLIEVSVEDEPLIAVVRDAGLQAGAAATVVVDAKARRVYLDWAPSATSGGEAS